MIKKTIGIFLIIFIAIFVINFAHYYSKKPYNVALIKITGIINQDSIKDWIKQLSKAERSKNFKGVIIEINSPGGGANDSERLYRAVKKLNNKKPVFVLVDSICASGAYYAACGADKIFAYPTSIIGSIGVIFESLNVTELSKRVGVDMLVVKSGKLKDVGNPFRKPTKDDKKMLQSVVDGIYNEFINVVSTSRHIDKDKLKQYANGSVFASYDAKKIGLIDYVGGLDLIKSQLKKTSHIKHIRMVEIKPKKPLLKELMGEQFSFVFDYIYLLFNPSVKMIYHD